MQDHEQYGFPWTEAEFLAVLDAYLAHRGQPRHDKVDWVLEIASLLGRTPAAVSMRLENYAAVDPDVRSRVGLRKGGAKCAHYFAKYADRPGELREIARITLDHQRAGRRPMLFQKPVEIPKAFGHYELLDQLGQGGFGLVFSCIDANTGTAYAMKLLRRDRLSGDSEEFHRFRREIRVLKGLQHPGIIKLFDDNLDEDRDDPAYVMELADCSLRAWLDDRALERRSEGKAARPACDLAEALNIVRSVCAALHAMHTGSPRLCHRDVNPNNIFRRPDGSWVLGDFGLAKFLSTVPAEASYVTQRSQAGWGTEAYTAPEQWDRFGSVDERADVYSVGVLLWDILTSRLPPIRMDNLGLPSELEECVKRAAAYERQERFRTMADLVQYLEGLSL